jgi:hypothetical protein
MKKGISLIVLIITIIVIIILAGSVILSLSENNPIISAEEATFRNDIDSLQNELNMQIMNQLTQTLGTFDSNTMTGEVSEYIPSVTKYDDTFDIVKGKLVYTGNDDQILAYVRNMNLDLITVYDGTAEIVKPTTSVINKDEGTVEAWVNVTNVMRNEITEKYIFSTYSDEKYTNTLALRHTRDNTWQAIMSSDYNNVSDISVADTLVEGWHLFSLKWSSTEFSLFIDGVKVATDATPTLIQAVSTDLHIGSGPRLNLVRNGYVTSGDNGNFSNLIRVTDDYYSSSASLKGVNQIMIESSDFIPVETSKVYYQSGQFKALKIGSTSNNYYGIMTYDKDKNYIGDAMTNHYINTETELTQDLKPGDTIVYVKNAMNWKKTADSSGNKYLAIYPYKDYPLYTYTRNNYQFINSDIVNNTITLKTSYTGALIPAGTKVANNYGCFGSYTYSSMGGSVIPNTWKKYSSNITGESINTSSFNQFRYATRYIRIMMLMNWYNNSSDSILVDDIEFIDTTNTIYNSKIQEICVSNIARSDSDILNRYKTGILSKDSSVTYMLTEQ